MSQGHQPAATRHPVPLRYSRFLRRRRWIYSNRTLREHGVVSHRTSGQTTTSSLNHRNEGSPRRSAPVISLGAMQLMHSNEHFDTVVPRHCSGFQYHSNFNGRFSGWVSVTGNISHCCSLLKCFKDTQTGCQSSYRRISSLWNCRLKQPLRPHTARQSLRSHRIFTGDSRFCLNAIKT